MFLIISEDEKDSKTDREMKSTLFLVNIVLTTKVKKLQEEIKELNEKIQKYELQGLSGNVAFNNELGKRKRKRKTKDQVERNYKCNIDNCTKSYGSENSLNQHMKLKHPEFWAKIKEKENILTASSGDKKKRLAEVKKELDEEIRMKAEKEASNETKDKQVVISQPIKIEGNIEVKEESK